VDRTRRDVDEYRLLIHPVALGSGLGLFSSLARPIDLKLISTTAFGGGAIAKVYRPHVDPAPARSSHDQSPEEEP